MAAHEALRENQTKHGITVVEANKIREAVLKATNGKLNIRNSKQVNAAVLSMVTLKGKGGRPVVYDNGNIKVTNNKKKDKDGKPLVEEKFFIDALFSDEYEVVQNVRSGKGKKTPIRITSNELGVDKQGRPQKEYKAETIGKDYDGYLKERLSSTVVGYNMGTEQDPAFTISVQPIILMKGNSTAVTPTTQEVEKTEPEFTPKTTEKAKAEEKKADSGITHTKKEITEADNTIYEEIRDTLRKFNGLAKETKGDQMIPSMSNTDLIKEALNNVVGLPLDAQANVIKYLTSVITGQHTDKILDIATLHKDSKEIFESKFRGTLSELRVALKKTRELVKEYPGEESFEVLEANVDLIIKDTEKVVNNFETFFKNTVEKIKKENLVPLDIEGKTEEELAVELQDHQQSEMNDKNHYKSANEDIHKTKIGPELKKIFYNLPSGQTGFLGLDIPMDFDLVYNMVSTYLASSKNTDPTFDGMMKELKKIDQEKAGWVTLLIEELEKAPEKVKNGFVSNMYKHAANAKFIMFIKNKEGVDSAVWFSNANNIDKKIRTTWYNNFKRSHIVSGSTLDSESLKGVVEQFEEEHLDWAKGENLEDARDWLAYFGIVLTDNTWGELVAGNLVIPEKGVKGVGMPFRSLILSPSSSKKRSKELFDNLYTFAKMNMDKKAEDLNYISNEKLNPFKEMGNILKGLVPLEVKHNKSLINITRRDGGKTVSEVVYPSFFIDNMNKIINDAGTEEKTYLNELSESAFSQSSMLLEVLLENDEMADIFDYGEVGLMSMRNQYGDMPERSNIDQISPIDYIFNQRAMFQDTQTEKINIEKDNV